MAAATATSAAPAATAIRDRVRLRRSPERCDGSRAAGVSWRAWGEPAGATVVGAGHEGVVWWQRIGGEALGRTGSVEGSLAGRVASRCTAGPSLGGGYGGGGSYVTKEMALGAGASWGGGV